MGTVEELTLYAGRRHLFDKREVGVYADNLQD